MQNAVPAVVQNLRGGVDTPPYSIQPFPASMHSACASLCICMNVERKGLTLTANC